MKSHPYADLFPMMTTAELDALAEDIAANGLRHPIVRYKGDVLDGRNRLKACEKANVKPTFIDHEGDEASALALVISLNVQRRELTAAQRAIVAARAWGVSGYSKAGRPTNGEQKSVKTLPIILESVAKQFKCSKPSIIQARDLLAESPDLAMNVESCAVSLAGAYEQLQQRRAQEAQRTKDATQKAKDAEKAAEFKEAVSNGEMTLDEALQKAMQDQREEQLRIATETDARSSTLRELADRIGWFERFFKGRTDDDLAWFTIPGSPGLIDHGITSDRVLAVVGGLQRAAIHTFGGKK